MNDLFSLVDWSRAQFALTAMYHWLFVPLTLGLGLIVAVMETLYYRTGDERWKTITKFWMTLFGVNFAIGVATGIILEFQFGTNWSNYSWFVGDIFGAPLAIEGIMAFFMEATFIAIMFFGWNKVSKGAHLTATWLTVAGATISALWILVANAWMQYPVGMQFNPDTVRNEMMNFTDVIFSPVAINKFFHTVTSGWVLGGVFVVAISAWFMLRKREAELAGRSMKVGAWVGLVGMCIVAYTGDGSAFQVAEKQPMKLAAMEGVYHGEEGQGLVAFGILNPEKKSYNDSISPFLFEVKVPKLLSLLATRHIDGFVPGINDIIDGGYMTKNIAGEEIIALSAIEKMERGRKAVEALGQYKVAQKAGDKDIMTDAANRLRENYEYFGYGYITDPAQLVPHVPFVFYSFHIMITLAAYFLIFFIVVLILQKKGKMGQWKWMQWICILSLPVAYICLESGWIVAEMGRQPWVIQDIMPTNAAISKIATTSVQTTFWLFAVLFTVLLIAEVGIMLKQIKKGTEQKIR
ncbi:cytochrome ubiquinol oxidase subunit I [Coprobacter tertius]|uniref:Cytochrome ubiquinol oxidase subunit I n=1 Tax=Coprobacter tertius TaxID=2944915 RepID=A0ABT1MFS4_9BACT|nr:cytochrome ubiquinol oxidase subunit I [Coprobacter tertius]MCP9611204.1 cytochrome ubiquinol oxidase subunit I [Coprobacter tertius]